MVQQDLSPSNSVASSTHDTIESMKNKSKQVRVSLKAYEQVRRVAFRAHKPMSSILEEIIFTKTKS